MLDLTDGFGLKSLRTVRGWLFTSFEIFSRLPPDESFESAGGQKWSPTQKKNKNHTNSAATPPRQTAATPPRKDPLVNMNRFAAFAEKDDEDVALERTHLHDNDVSIINASSDIPDDLLDMTTTSFEEGNPSTTAPMEGENE
jgi:hypothetical protein